MGQSEHIDDLLHAVTSGGFSVDFNAATEPETVNWKRDGF